MKATIKIIDNGAYRLNVPNGSIAEAEINTRELGSKAKRSVRFADDIYINGRRVGGCLSEHSDDGKPGWKIIKTY